MRLPGPLLATTTLLVAASVLVSCGGSNSGFSVSPPSPQGQPSVLTAALTSGLHRNDTAAVLARGSVEGFAFKSCPTGDACVAPVVSLDPRRAASDGLVPAPGETVSLSGVATTARTDSSGHFVLQAPSGHYDLAITNADTHLLKTRVAIIGLTTVSVSPTTISREQAAEKVEQALGTSTDPETTCILSPLQPLPKGTKVAPALGNDSGDIDPALTYQLPSPQWFVYVDGEVVSNFHHAVKYYFIDAESGALTTRTASSWPAINGLNYYATDAILSSEDLLKAPPVVTTAAASIARRQGPDPLSQRLRKRHVQTRDSDLVPGTLRVMLVQGTRNEGFGSSVQDDSAFGRDITHIRDFLKSVTTSYDEVLWQPPNTRQGFLTLYSQLVGRTEKQDTFVLYVTAHGDVKPSFQLDQKKVEDGTEGLFDSLQTTDLDFSKLKASTIIVILEACHTGKWIPKLEPKLAALPGRHWLILTATDATGYVKNGEEGGQALSLPAGLAMYGISGSVYTRLLISEAESAVGQNVHPFIKVLKQGHDEAAHNMSLGRGSVYLTIRRLTKIMEAANPQIAGPGPDHLAPNPGTY